MNRGFYYQIIRGKYQIAGIKKGQPMSEAWSRDAPCRCRVEASLVSASGSVNLSAHQLGIFSLAESLVLFGICSALDCLVYDVSELVKIDFVVCKPDAT